MCDTFIGKTYLYNTLLHTVRGMNKSTIAAASTGIAGTKKNYKSLHGIINLYHQLIFIF